MGQQGVEEGQNRVALCQALELLDFTWLKMIQEFKE